MAEQGKTDKGSRRDHEFNTNVSLRYHRRLEGHYEHCHTWAGIASTVLPLLTIGILIVRTPEETFWWRILPALALAVILLQFVDHGVTKRWLMYKNFADRYGVLILAFSKLDYILMDRATIAAEQRGEVSAEEQQAIALERLQMAYIDLRTKIEVEEPGRRRLLYDLCYREVLIANGRNEEAEKILLPNAFWRMCAVCGDFGYVTQTPLRKEN